VDDQRRKSVFTQGSATTTRYYLDDYEEVYKPDGTTQKIHYLSGGSMMLQQGAAKSLYYGYHDYQGSLIAWTNQSGTVVERRAYDPWGRHRNPQNWTEVDYTSPSRLNNRGYTGHEHLDASQIINMNGRVYDPLTAQFFSPDPFVQAPDNWLNYNRYAYCLNNPLIYTDPDGEWAWLIFAVYGAWQMGLQAGFAAESNGGDFWKEGFWKGALVGFATGALGSIAPFGTEWVGSMAWGAILGTASQAGTIWANGGNDYSKIWQGALLGGAMGFISSQQFGNWVEGKGFVNNNQVLTNFSSGKYDITGFDTWQDAALDYFGFEGKYDPTINSPGQFNSKDQTISYNDVAFSKNYDYLKEIVLHEYKHRSDFLAGKYGNLENIDPLSFEIDVKPKAEWETCQYTYRNQGLYPKGRNEIELISNINSYGIQAGKYGFGITLSTKTGKVINSNKLFLSI
jgi:RHS repeat-associated protein